MIQQELIKVGMADLNIVTGQGVLRTTGLGSCVGVTLYDPLSKIAGMAHVMLPSSSIAKAGNLNKAKFADTAIPELVTRMTEIGASVSRMQAKLAGGAQMFALPGQADTMRIGPRNVEACKAALHDFNIQVKGEDTGGNYGRTIELLCETGVLIIRSVQKGNREL
ncbi:chemotaxis protein CheD [Paenibacillus larvae]